MINPITPIRGHGSTKNIDQARRINAIPRYIGFLDNLYVPEITKEVADFGLRGLKVVFALRKEASADNEKMQPKIMHKIMHIILMAPTESGTPEDKNHMVIEKNNAIKGGGILFSNRTVIT
jgi:hypothetical protein